MSLKNSVPGPAELADNPTAGLVTPVIRGLRLLEFIAQGGSTENLSETGRLIDVNRVTVMRLLATLEHEGMIEKLPGGGYQVGLRYLTMAAKGMGGHDLISTGRRVVRGLCQQTGHAAYLSLPDGPDITYVLREMPPAGLVSLITIGSRIAAWRAAPGQAILAALPSDVLTRRTELNALAEADPDAFQALRIRLEAVKAQGYAWSHSGLEQGISACAVAVTDRSGQPVAALSVAGPAQALAEETARRKLETALRAAGQQLSTIAFSA